MGREQPHADRMGAGILLGRAAVVSPFLVASVVSAVLPSDARAVDAHAVRPPPSTLVGTWDFEDHDELLAVDGNSKTLSIIRRSADGRVRFHARFGRSRPVPVRISRGRVIVTAPRRVGRRSGRVRYVGRVERAAGVVVLEGRTAFLRPRLAGRSSFRAVKRVRSSTGTSAFVRTLGRLGANDVPRDGRPGS